MREVEILYPVECPTCFASPGNRCRTLRLRRVTDYHSARREKWAWLMESNRA